MIHSFLITVIQSWVQLCRSTGITFRVSVEERRCSRTVNRNSYISFMAFLVWHLQPKAVKSTCQDTHVDSWPKDKNMVTAMKSHRCLSRKASLWINYTMTFLVVTAFWSNGHGVPHGITSILERAEAGRLSHPAPLMTWKRMWVLSASMWSLSLFLSFITVVIKPPSPELADV